MAQFFHTVIIRDVPQLNTKKRAQARRFITLIDTLYDHHVSQSASEYCTVGGGGDRVCWTHPHAVVGSSYRPLVMDLSPQLPPGTNYTTSTIVPRIQRTPSRQSRTGDIHGPDRLPVEHRAPFRRCWISVN